MRFLFAIALSLVAPFVLADPPGDWSFFSAQQSYRAEWGLSHGVARVDIASGRIKIRIYEVITILPEGREIQSPEVTESIEGTISRSGQIKAVHLIHNSDVEEMKVTGRYYRREEKEKWGDEEVVVVYESIVFEDETHVFGFARRKRQ